MVKTKDDASVLHDLYVCFTGNVPVPPRVKTAFVERFKKGHESEIKSWDDVFGKPTQKMNHVIEGTLDEEREGFKRLLGGLDLYQRIQTASAIGNLLGLINAERVKLKLWQFKPIDATDDELEEQRKARRRENRRAKRRAHNVKPREVYLAEMASKPKPWIAEGISRRTWERRLKTMSQGVVPTIVTKVVPDLASPSSVESQRGYHEGVLVEKHQLEAMESEQMDTNASSSPGLVTDLATPDENNPLMAALDNLARASWFGTTERGLKKFDAASTSS